jgi:leucine dehydrogenase
VRKLLARESLTGTTVAIQGLGAVGSHLCSLLANAGAKLWVTDSVPDKVEAAVKNFGATAVIDDEILQLKVDVFARARSGVP